MRYYGIIGHPVDHSMSADYFTRFFADNGIEAVYQRFDVPETSQLEAVIRHGQLAGANVTIPHKIHVMNIVDTLSDEAREIGAVNVLKILREGDDIRVLGFNTDALGFRDSIAPRLGARRKALLFGTGGGAKAVAYALKTLGIEYTIVSRTPQQGQIAYQELTEDIIADNLIIINATPLGMAGQWEGKSINIPLHAIGKQHLVYDIIHTPKMTPLMLNAKQQGAQVVGGTDMFLRQAEATWKIWNNDNLKL